ncbi:MAG: class-II fumarase/aspartase family protein [Wenzhouxiangella sp.]
MAQALVASTYYRDMFSAESMRDVFSDRSCFEAWILVEIALVRAQVRVNIIPPGVDEVLAAIGANNCLNVATMKADFDRVGFPILPFVKQLTQACDEETARWVHYGATTQDVLDTGTVLQIRSALVLVEQDLDVIIGALSAQAQRHRETVMAGRTFQQLAAPITLGYKLAVWLDELLRHRERLEQLKPRILVAQLAGAVGTFATLGDKGPEVLRAFAKELDLGVPAITWHTARDGWAELVNLWALLGATLAKIANEIAILMRSEIGELSEPFETGRGASTTLPQKRNPISCEPIIAISHRLREMAGSQMSAMIQEHERGVGQMHIEWMVVPESFILLSGSLKHARFILENLVVDSDAMRRNLDLQGGLIMSEAVMMGLAPLVGKAQAHHLVYAAAGRANDEGLSLREALLADTEVMAHLDEATLNSLLDPANYTGSAGTMVDTVIARAESVLAKDGT